MKNIKRFSMTVFLLLGLLGLTAMVSAASDFYDVTQVKVEGITVSSDDQVEVEVGETVDIDVFVEGNASVDGVRVKAWLGGYEHGDVEAVSSSFDVKPGVSYKKSLSLELPADLDVEDGNTYTLYVEVYDSEDSEQETYTLFVERPRHAVDVLDVVHDATVNAGDDLGVEVRLKNIGQAKEEDIKVKVTLADAEDATYVDELAAFEDDSEDAESSGSVEFSLPVSESTASGEYELTVIVTYDDGHETVEQVSTVTVEGTEAPEKENTEEGADVTLSLSARSLSGEAGQASSVQLTFANTGTAAATYTVSVAGVDQWATTDVTPSVVVVESKEVSDVTVTVTPDNDASGDYEFTVNVLDADGALVKEVTLNMTVDEKSGLLSDSGTAIKVGFVVLLVVIIIIGLVVAFRKLGDGDDDEPLEPKDGKTYY